jgi:hypothetical protein
MTNSISGDGIRELSQRTDVIDRQSPTMEIAAPTEDRDRHVPGFVKISSQP